MDFTTPVTPDISRKPFVDKVYDMAEDTFLLMDALQSDAVLLKERK